MNYKNLPKQNIIISLVYKYKIFFNTNYKCQKNLTAVF